MLSKQIILGILYILTQHRATDNGPIYLSLLSPAFQCEKAKAKNIWEAEKLPEFRKLVMSPKNYHALTSQGQNPSSSFLEKKF
jgi:hypothetical protein